MKTVAFYARKGGVGKSTLAFITACFAARTGQTAQLTAPRVMLVSLDPQGDAVRWSAVGGSDSPLRRDDVITSPHGFAAMYSPGQLPPVNGQDLVIVDCPPEADQAIPLVKPAWWVVVLDGRAALIDTMAAIPAMRSQGGDILFVINKADTGGTRVEAELLTQAHKVPQTQVCPYVIPISGAIARVAEYYAPPWDVPYGKGSAGGNAAERFCANLLKRVR